MISSRLAASVRRRMIACVAMTAVACASGPEMTTNKRDTLVYKDGDRVLGTLVQQTPDTIVFWSERFGELRVAANDAVVIPADKGDKPASSVAAAAATAKTTSPAAPASSSSAGAVSTS